MKNTKRRISKPNGTPNGKTPVCLRLKKIPPKKNIYDLSRSSPVKDIVLSAMISAVSSKNTNEIPKDKKEEVFNKIWKRFEK